MPCCRRRRPTADASTSADAWTSSAPLIGGDHPIANLDPSLVALVKAAEADPSGALTFAGDCKPIPPGGPVLGWSIRLVPPYQMWRTYSAFSEARIPLRRKLKGESRLFGSESARQLSFEGTASIEQGYQARRYIVEIPLSAALSPVARDLGITTIGRVSIGVGGIMHPTDSLVYPPLRSPHPQPSRTSYL